VQFPLAIISAMPWCPFLHFDPSRAASHLLVGDGNGLAGA
jgi:hypothetical protein